MTYTHTFFFKEVRKAKNLAFGFLLIFHFCFMAVGLLCLALPMAAAQQVASPENPALILDTLTIGNAASEGDHQLKLGASERFTGGLGEHSVKLLPSGTETRWESAPMEFVLKVDGEQQNYITVRLWGSDKGEELGRLLVFVDGKQLGYRGAGDHGSLNQTEAEAEAPGRFIYQTLPLPIHLTNGKSSVKVRVVALGPRWWYGDTFEKYQKPFTKESRGIYGFYTHTNCYFTPPASEKQGETPKALVRPPQGKDVIEESRAVVIGRLNRLLDAKINLPKRPDAFQSPILFLAGAYNTEWTPAYRNPKTIERIVELGDVAARDFFEDPTWVAKYWSGSGPLGEALIGTWPQISERMEEKIELSGEQVTRAEAWSRVLKGSVDYWRTHRRSYTNQSMFVDYSIYTANRGLALIKPALALPESRALRYLYEAVGIEPWRGSDKGGETTGEKDVPYQNVSEPFGSNYYLITKKGISRELGFVAGYGEVNLKLVGDMAVLTGDERIRQQLRKIANARLPLRYPALDPDGFRCMKLSGEIDERVEHFPVSGAAYAESYSSREIWGMGLAAILHDDPKTVGATQQSLDDKQYYAMITSRLKSADSIGMMRNVDDYTKVKSLPPHPERLPMTDGQPDFVFTDEESPVVAIKHGERRLFVNLYFRAENAVNRVARVLEITPQITRIATVMTDVEVNESGETFVRPDHVQGIRKEEKLKPPGDTTSQAWAGEIMPIAKRPDDASQPAYGAWGPFVGKADFYTLQYGNYLIAMNTTSKRTFTLPGRQFDSMAIDLVTGRTVESKENISVTPLSTVVLYLGARK